MDKHITILGILHIVASATGLFVSGIVLLTVVGGSALSGDPDALIGIGVGTLIAGFFAVLSVPGLVTGIGLLMRKPWSRILGLIVGIIHLINIPLGTLLGAYTIWVLMQDETIQLLGGTASRPAPAL